MEIQIQNTIQFYFPTTAVSLSVFSATMQKKKTLKKYLSLPPLLAILFRNQVRNCICPIYDVTKGTDDSPS